MFATNASFKKSSNLESGTVNAGQTRDKYENSDSERSSPVMMLTYYALDITSLIFVLIVLIPRNAIQRWEGRNHLGARLAIIRISSSTRDQPFNQNQDDATAINELYQYNCKDQQSHRRIILFRLTSKLVHM